MKDNKRFYSIYHQVCSDAQKAYQYKQIDMCYQLIQTAASIAYSYNQFFFDEKLESLLKRNTELLYNTNQSSIPDKTLQTTNKKVIFMDTSGLDNRGLTQQYIRALIALNYSFLYIYIDGQTNGLTNNPKTIEEIKKYPKAKIAVFSKDTKYSHKIKKITQIIQEYNPESILLHLMPWDVVSLSVIHQLKHIKSYNINLTDEAFWLGASFIDYNIEFRNYGYTISLEQRKLKQEQLLYLPYNPIIPSDQKDFQGFPSNIPTDKLKIFTGGNFYKIFDEKNSFFKLMDAILQANVNSVILIAGHGNLKELYKRIQTMSNKNRVFYIGIRKDINEVFKQTDIYLSTYPISGALMAQYAATNAKPIIAYTEEQLIDNKLEEVICHKIHTQISFYDFDSTIQYSRDLCNDDEKRKKEGILLQNAITTENEFNIGLNQILKKAPSIILKQDKIDYKYISQIYLSLRKDSFKDIITLLLKSYKCKFILKFPYLILYIPAYIVQKARNLIKNK